MSQNKEWSAEENAYCFIKLLEWERIRNTTSKDNFLDEILNNKYFKARIRPTQAASRSILEQHLDYLYDLVNGTLKDPNNIPDKDKIYYSIYP